MLEGYHIWKDAAKEEDSALLYKIVFSPTGGTDSVANVLCGALAETFETIDLSDSKFDGSVVSLMADDRAIIAMPCFGGHKRHNTSVELRIGEIDGSVVSLMADDRAIIAMPCFGGLVPEIAVERLKALNGNESRCAVVCVYGNRAYEDGLIEMEDAARDAGFDVRAGVAAIAEHSIMHQYATGRPDATDVDNLIEAAAAIAQALVSEAPKGNPPIPGNRPYKKAGAVGLVPAVDKKKCVKCGKCAEGCPVQAIESKEFKASKDRCISCMRCIAVCPQDARHVNKLMVGVAAQAIKKAASVRKEVEFFV